MGKDFSNGGHLGRDLKSKEASYVDVWEKRSSGEREERRLSCRNRWGTFKTGAETRLCGALQAKVRTWSLFCVIKSNGRAMEKF